MILTLGPHPSLKDLTVQLHKHIFNYPPFSLSSTSSCHFLSKLGTQEANARMRRETLWLLGSYLPPSQAQHIAWEGKMPLSWPEELICCFLPSTHSLTSLCKEYKMISPPPCKNWIIQISVSYWPGTVALVHMMEQGRFRCWGWKQSRSHQGRSCRRNRSGGSKGKN